MKMNTETQKFSRVVYSLVILWCCVIKVYGGSDINVDPLLVSNVDRNINLFNILSGNLSRSTVNPSHFNLSVTIRTGAIYFNITFLNPYSNTNGNEHKRPIKIVRDDYTLTEGIGYHKFHSRKLDWNDARKVCIDENAHLAVLNSEKEEMVLRQMMIKYKGGAAQAYIGAHDLFEEGDWVTITGESLGKAGFDKWSDLWPNEPDNFAGNQNCAVLRVEGGMDDLNCSFQHYFICEIPL